MSSTPQTQFGVEARDSGSASVLPWSLREFELDPYPWYDRVLREAPVVVDDNGVFIVSRYEDVLKFGRHPAMSVEPGWAYAGPWNVVSATMIGRDEPDHTRLKRQTNKWFAPKRVREWVETTRLVTLEALAGIGDQGQIDGWHDLAVPSTHRTMCRVLGLPDASVGVIKDAVAATMVMLRARPRQAEIEAAQSAFDFLQEHVRDLLGRPERGFEDGMARALLDAQDQGELSENEAFATIFMFYILGHMDVGYTVASGLQVFAENPAVYEAFRADSTNRAAILEEVIRYDPPELSFYRVAIEEVEIGGTVIPTGSTVRFMLAAANRDPDVFTNPNKFDFTRPVSQTRNLSFGVGAHTCAGQAISRAQALVVWETIAERYPRIELVEPPAVDNTDYSRHYVRLPLMLSRWAGY